MEKQKLIHLGLVSAENYQVSSTPQTELEQFRNFLRLNITDLNEYLLKLEEAYRESLFLLGKGALEEGKSQFEAEYTDVKTNIHEIENEVEAFLREFPIPNDKEQEFLYSSYKDQWNSEKSKIISKIEETYEKFKLRCQFGIDLEDILRFEVENERPITDTDLNKFKFPFQQAKQIIKFIEKPVNFNLNELSSEEKQKYGTLGRKIIEICSQNHVTPNLPFLVIKAGIALLEAKKILTYLHSIGMIDRIYYHYKKQEIMPR